MSGRRRDYVSLSDRLGQQREDRVRLRRHLKLVPQPPEPQPEPVRQLTAWGQNFRVWALSDEEQTAWRIAPYTFTLGFQNAANALTNIGTSITSATGAFTNITYTLNGNTMGTPITMQPGTIVNADYPTPQVRFDYTLPPPVLRTPEEQAADAARIQRQREQREEAHRRRVTAQDRARTTLLEFLTPEQRADYAQHEYFYVEGSAGNLYRIDLGNAGNVMYCDRATLRPLASICAHPSMHEHWLPNQDVQLAQKLALEFDEPGFTAIANVHWGIRPPNADLSRRGGPAPADARLYAAA